MALNIKNPQVEQLAEEIAGMTGESKTEAIRNALLERRDACGTGLFRTTERNGSRRF